MAKKLMGITKPDFELWLVGAHKALNLPAPAELAVTVGFSTLRYLSKEELTDALAAMVAGGRVLGFGESLATVLLRAHRHLKEGGTVVPNGPCAQGCIRGAFYLLSPEGRAGSELCAHCHPMAKRSISRADIENYKAGGWLELSEFEYMRANVYGPRYLAMRQQDARA